MDPVGACRREGEETAETRPPGGTSLRVTTPREAFPDPRRIALVVRRLTSRDGGRGRCVQDLARRLSDDGFAVTCLYHAPSPAAALPLLDSRVEQINLAPVRMPLAVRVARFAARLRVVPRPLRRRARSHARDRIFFIQLRDYFVFGRPTLAASLQPSADGPTFGAAAGTGVTLVSLAGGGNPSRSEDVDAWVAAIEQGAPAAWNP